VKMNHLKKIRILCISFLLFFTLNAWAIEEIRYQDWAVQLGVDTAEAYVSNKDNTSFGFFCKEEKCVYYLNLNLNCPTSTKNPVLMSGGEISAAFMMTCANLGGRTFQIFDDPEIVNKAVKSSKAIGFSMALPGGAFIVSQFSLNNAQAAIERVIYEAKQRKEQPQGQGLGGKGLIKI